MFTTFAPPQRPAAQRPSPRGRRRAVAVVVAAVLLGLPPALHPDGGRSLRGFVFGGPDATAATPVTTPSARQIAAARRYAEGRRGVVSFAVVDTAGTLRGRHRTRVYKSASVVKAMTMAAYLDRLERRDEPLTGAGRALLGPMIRSSDNDTMSRLYGIVGAAGLNRVARRAGMRRFAPMAAWGSSRITAEDQARFFVRIDELVPERFRSYARSLLRSIVGPQRWGIPRAAPRNYRVLFKGGWRSGGRGGRIVHQVAKLERGERELSIAILTDGNPSHAYGTETVRGVAARLLR